MIFFHIPAIFLIMVIVPIPGMNAEPSLTMTNIPIISTKSSIGKTTKKGTLNVSDVFYANDNNDIRASVPNLFSENGEDSVYTRYAACLAATEGLRNIRDKVVKHEKKRRNKSTTTNKSRSKAEKYTLAQYDQQSKEIMKLFGLSPKDFKILGKQIMRNEILKDKVLEQAYLYRMVTAVNVERRPNHKDNNEMKKVSTSLDSVPLLGALLARKKKYREFSRSMYEIETLRQQQLMKLQRSLQLSKLPDQMDLLTDPQLLPLLSPRVRAVVKAFPYQANNIARKHGLNPDEFHEMFLAAKKNPLFRRRIRKQINMDKLNSLL